MIAMIEKRTGSQAIPEDVILAETDKTSDEWFEILNGFGIYGYDSDAAMQFLCRVYELSAWWAQTIVIRYEWESGIRQAYLNIPKDLEQALINACVLAKFQSLAYSHQREYIEWVESANKSKTRQRRIEKTVARVEEM